MLTDASLLGTVCLRQSDNVSISFRADNRCYLKDSSAPENIEDDEDYVSAPVQCQSEFWNGFRN